MNNHLYPSTQNYSWVTTTHGVGYRTGKEEYIHGLVRHFCVLDHQPRFCFHFIKSSVNSYPSREKDLYVEELGQGYQMTNIIRIFRILLCQVELLLQSQRDKFIPSFIHTDVHSKNIYHNPTMCQELPQAPGSCHSHEHPQFLHLLSNKVHLTDLVKWAHLTETEPFSLAK